MLPTKYLLAIGIGTSAVYLSALWLNSKKASVQPIPQQPANINTIPLARTVEAAPLSTTISPTLPEKKTVTLKSGLTDEAFDEIIHSLKNTTDLIIEIDNTLEQNELEQFLSKLKPLAKLKHVNLRSKSNSQCKITHFPNALRQLSQITSLTILSLGRVVNTFPSDVNKFWPNLTQLEIGSSICRTKDKDNITHPIWQLSSLKKLSLNAVHISGLIESDTLPNDICLPNLESLSIFNSGSFNIPENLGGCHKLRHLILSSKDDTIPFFPKSLLNLNQLVSLDIWYNDQIWDNNQTPGFYRKPIANEKKNLLMTLIDNNPNLEKCAITLGGPNKEAGKELEVKFTANRLNNTSTQ